MGRSSEVRKALDEAVPPLTEDEQFQLALRLTKAEGDNVLLRERLRTLRAEVAEEIAQVIEGATGTGIYISRTTAARIAREHGKES